MLRNAVRWRSRSLLFILSWCLLRSGAAFGKTSTSTVYFRQQSGGSIFAIDGRDGSETEIEGSSEYARFVGLAIHRRHGRIFWSDGRAVKSANATDGSDVEVVVGALARVVWVGTNFGQSQADVQMLTVKGTRCDSIISWSPERVECIVGLPLRFSQTQLPFVSEDDCSIQTNHGSMTGIALNYNEMFALGTSSPIVERVDIYANFVLPHALAIDDREGEDWLYWSNLEDGTIYRSSLRSNVIEVLQRRCWSVRGLALNIFQDAGKERVSLMYSLESKAQVLLSGLRSPRGLAMDSTNQILFFTEKTGRIFQVRLGKTMTARKKASILPDDASIVSPGVGIRRIATLASMTRLDGIAVDSKYLYWCETNTNTVARALRRDFQRQVVVGGTANSMLSWPRGIALGSDDGDINDLKHSFYYSEYTGRVSRGSSQTVIVNEASREYNFFVSIAHSLFNSHHSKQPKHQKMVSFSKTSLAILFAISATSTDADVSGNLRHESRTLQAKYTSTNQYAASMLASVNAQRAAQGLPALCMNTKLMAASMRHSTDMAVNNFMSHTGSDGSTMSMRVTAAGYKWTRVAENVAAGQSSVAAVMTSWMNSPGHRANILGDYTMFGTAYAYNIGSTYKHYWTQNFGKGSTEACSYEDV
ncbi:hypothetical protein PI124_g22055, partial [Phytophthora idaei]